MLAIILSVPTFLKDSAEPLVSDDDRLRQAAQDLIDSGGMPTTTPPTPTENRYLTKLRSYPDIARVLGLTENYYVDALTRGQYICARFDDGRIKSSVIRDMVTGTTRDDIDVADANLIIRAATATLCPEHEAEGR
ncbi:DUF732 domain-containing protein [Antrihabitans spumae]|uniref:DUF732 domain-containing protein n=1 Tax=Antrihabitans spumae TaxID=3373370 RepID=A0ABW7KJ47_9NOCA